MRNLHFPTPRRLTPGALLALTLPLCAQNVPTTINYQGRLTDNTPQQNPLTAAVTMQFEIWDVASGGTVFADRLWREPNADNTGVPVTVTNGLFNYVLGNGVAIPPTVFNGTASTRYLQIIVNPDAAAETLAPRQLLTATAYTNRAEYSVYASTASYANGAGDSNALAGTAATGWQKALALTNCGAGQFYQSLAQNGSATCASANGALAPPVSLSGAVAFPGAVLSAVNSGTGDGLYGENSGTAANAVAVHGKLSSTAIATGGNAAAVRGENLTTNGTGYGIWGSHASGGAGVYGSSAGTGFGVLGNSQTGTAVQGLTNGTSSGTAGVAGGSLSASGLVYGVSGQSNSSTSQAAGVYGTDGASSGAVVGVYGSATLSPSGTGVVGRGAATGGYFEANAASAGNGVIGQSDATTGVGAGVTGTSASATGYGVLGANSAGGYAGYFSGTVHATGDIDSAGRIVIGVYQVTCNPSASPSDCACTGSDPVISGGGFIAAPGTIRTTRPFNATTWRVVCETSGGVDTPCANSYAVCLSHGG